MWRPASEPLASIRQRISDKPAEWAAVSSGRKFRRHYNLGGEILTRPPRGYAKDHAMIEDIKRKDFIAVKNMTHEDALNPRFQQKVETAFEAAGDYMRFLCKATGVRY